MSKVGQFNIAMTEKVNELGYETVEEAIADGWDSNEFYMSYMKEVKDEQEKAHEAWLEEREIVLSKLDEVLGFFKRISNYKEVSKELKKESNMNIGRIRRAMNFIERGEQ